MEMSYPIEIVSRVEAIIGCKAWPTAEGRERARLALLRTLYAALQVSLIEVDGD